ncbi:phosphoenolpyruvate carboxykinase (ATP) [Acidisoma silvae]|uniref:Phosphoenolpyruvate carboxykinase (ATP) n=1 Tax=Acidisoma silvae TaxID=2802396 RepID=A0A963YWQ8_9PROT|nr:phosphoenolpyruvate carboxykinase (ATP) [Acidisoma silvae]MCB8878548.1 phosphoenolpyruvate carboxykinase (ATP) [Acidisoma silvae]
MTGAEIHRNLSAVALVTQAIERREAVLSADGALVVETGIHTGRSVQDKFVVEDNGIADEIDWGKINQRLSRDNFARLTGHVQDYLQTQVLFVQDLYAGADPAHRIRVRVITTKAWHALFARNMFIRPDSKALESFVPDYVIFHAPDLTPDPSSYGLRSSTVIALSFAQRQIIIAGTQYAGEIKKAIFTVMNWALPEKGILPMHCSANIGIYGDVALFFGLSGTGKTTLSSDIDRPLIGDDEHGWSRDGVFNMEGGCYAKVIHLHQEAEPQIWAASHRFGAVLENVAIDSRGALDLDDNSKTENTRSCYPVHYIANSKSDGRGGRPRNVIMLTADAFGVLPPISKLTHAQAMYHFLSGYTARIAGTEKGLGKEPVATFSTCFGAPFLPRAPAVYGRLFRQYLSEQDVTCWLVNTGWTGGPYGVGHRMSIAHTRALLSAALDGSLDRVPFQTEPFFGLSIPLSLSGLPADLLNPADAWADADAYAAQARHLAGLFAENFRKFDGEVDDDIRAAAVGV